MADAFRGVLEKGERLTVRNDTERVDANAMTTLIINEAKQRCAMVELGFLNHEIRKGGWDPFHPITAPPPAIGSKELRIGKGTQPASVGERLTLLGKSGNWRIRRLLCVRFRVSGASA